MIEYEINRGVSNEIEFRGLRGKYVYYTTLGVGLSLFSGIVLSVLGIPNFVMVVIIAISIGASTYWGYAENKKYGRWGRTKLEAKLKIPKVLFRKHDSLKNLSN
jgi:hypothetical protein